MAENPLLKVARLVGGVALMQGGLGHQVLGQLLIAGTSQLAVAGAAVVVGGTARARNPAAQVAIRTAFPAMAVHAVFDKREQMLLHREREMQRRMQARRAPDFVLERENGELKRSNETLEKANADLHEKASYLAALYHVDTQFLRGHKEGLQAKLAELRKELGLPDESAAAAPKKNNKKRSKPRGQKKPAKPRGKKKPAKPRNKKKSAKPRKKKRER